jgi:hypothetical protein
MRDACVAMENDAASSQAKTRALEHSTGYSLSSATRVVHINLIAETVLGLGAGEKKKTYIVERLA